MNNQTTHGLKLGKAETAQSFPQLLAVSENKRSGLILCKANHAEFAGPGAAVGTLVEQACTSIIAIGAPEIVAVVTHKQRQTAYSRRIQWVRWLHKITEHPEPLQRAERLFSSLEAFFGAQVLTGLSDEVLALLIGVLPSTIATMRSQYRYSGQIDDLSFTPSCTLMSFSSIHLSPLPSPALAHSSAPTVASESFFEALSTLPCRA